VLRYWSASGAATGGKSLDAVLSLDAGKVMATCCAFPLRRELVGASEVESKRTAVVEEGEGVYDPAFVLPMLGAALVEGEMGGLDWVEVLRGNALGLTVCALASRDARMRTLAAWVLARALATVQVGWVGLGSHRT
jgi:nucleolar pre-ribosomal-associated protein 1